MRGALRVWKYSRARTFGNSWKEINPLGEGVKIAEDSPCPSPSAKSIHDLILMRHLLVLSSRVSANTLTPASRMMYFPEISALARTLREVWKAANGLIVERVAGRYEFAKLRTRGKIVPGPRIFQRREKQNFRQTKKKKKEKEKKREGGKRRIKI